MKNQVKKNTTRQDISVMYKREERIIRLSLRKAIIGIGGVFLSSVVGTTLVVVGVLNSDHFTLASLANEVKAFPATYQRQDVSAEQYRNLVGSITELKAEQGEQRKTLNEIHKFIYSLRSSNR